MDFPEATAEDLRVTALTVYGEARSEDVQGRQAVAWVVKNRTALYVKRMTEAGQPIKKDLYAATCLAKNQFSCWLPGDANYVILTTTFPLTDPSFANCIFAAVMVLGGHVEDPTHGATHYLNIETVLHEAGRLPTWAADPHDSQKVNEQLVVWRHERHTFLATA
jgi:Cell Wall Hydrolase